MGRSIPGVEKIYKIKIWNVHTHTQIKGQCTTYQIKGFKITKAYEKFCFGYSQKARQLFQIQFWVWPTHCIIDPIISLYIWVIGITLHSFLWKLKLHFWEHFCWAHHTFMCCSAALCHRLEGLFKEAGHIPPSKLSCIESPS